MHARCPRGQVQANNIRGASDLTSDRLLNPEGERTDIQWALAGSEMVVVVVFWAMIEEAWTS